MSPFCASAISLHELPFPPKNKRIRFLRIFHARISVETAKGQKLAERPIIPLGNNFQFLVRSKSIGRDNCKYSRLSLSRIWKKFLNISSFRIPSRARECTHPVFFSRQQVDPLFRISRLLRGPGRMQISGRKTWRVFLLGKSISFLASCVFDLALFTPPPKSYPNYSSPFLFFSFFTIVLPTFPPRFSFDTVITPPLRRHYYYDLLRFTVTGSNCGVIHRDLSTYRIRRGERQLVSITPAVITDAKRVSSSRRKPTS